MERKLTTISPFYAATAAVLTLTAVVAGCGGGTKNGAAGDSRVARPARRYPGRPRRTRWPSRTCGC